MSVRYHVVLVEDDEMLLKVLSNALRKHEFNVSPFSHGIAAYQFIQHSSETDFGPAHILVSDVQLPDISGLDIINQLSDYEPLGKILISVNGQDHHKISGLMVGADDYVSKPVNPEELVLRIRALLRRLNIQGRAEEISFLDLKLNPENKSLIKGQQQIPLGEAEVSLLLALISQQGKIVKRQYLIDCLGEKYAQGRALDMLVSRLRKKIGDDEEQEKYIVTYRNKGYMLMQEMY